VRYTHFFSSTNCHHGSGGAAVDFTQSGRPICFTLQRFQINFFRRYLFSANFCHHGSGGAAVDPSIQTGRYIFLTCFPEIFTNILAEDTWRKSSSSKTSWKLKMLFLVRKTHIFHPTKISN
jgi:hypothetical protein